MQITNTQFLDIEADGSNVVVEIQRHNNIARVRNPLYKVYIHIDDLTCIAIDCGVQNPPKIRRTNRGHKLPADA